MELFRQSQKPDSFYPWADIFQVTCVHTTHYNVKDEDVKLIKDSYFNLLAVFFEQEHIRGSHMRCILKWGVHLNISEHDIDVIGKGLHAPYVPPASEIDRLESVYHLVHMIYLDQMVEDSELEVASIYASRLGFQNGMVGDLFKSIATVEFDRSSPEDVRKEVIDFLKLQKS